MSLQLLAPWRNMRIAQRSEENKKHDKTASSLLEKGKIPLYTSTNSQCRDWIAKSLLFLSRKQAVAKAEFFTGAGPQLYTMDTFDWIKILGKFHGVRIRYLIRNILWDESKAKMAGMNTRLMRELRGEVPVRWRTEGAELSWDGMYAVVERIEDVSKLQRVYVYSE